MQDIFAVFAQFKNCARSIGSVVLSRSEQRIPASVDRHAVIRVCSVIARFKLVENRVSLRLRSGEYRNKQKHSSHRQSLASHESSPVEKNPVSVPIQAVPSKVKKFASLETSVSLSEISISLIKLECPWGRCYGLDESNNSKAILSPRPISRSNSLH